MAIPKRNTYKVVTFSEGLAPNGSQFYILKNDVILTSHASRSLAEEWIRALRKADARSRAAGNRCGAEMPCGIRDQWRVAHTCGRPAEHPDVDSPCVCKVCNPEGVQS